MTEVLLPPWIVPEVETHEWLDEGSSVFRAAFAPGLAQRQSYGGLRLKLSRRHTVRGEEKAQLLSVLKQTRGAYNVLRTKLHFALRGSGLGTELLTNNTFANGTTGWSVANGTLTVADRVGRVTAVQFGEVDLFQSVALTQYAPHVLRSMILDGAQSAGLTIGPSIQSGGISNSDYQTTRGLRTAVLVAASASAANQFTLVINALGAFTAGAYAEIPWTSLSRCALVDNGLNSLLQSDEFDTTWTPSAASVDDQTVGTNAPDGTGTADSIIEDTSVGSTHFVGQSVAISSGGGDYAFSVALKAGARTWARLVLFEDTSATFIAAYFNLSTGIVGTTFAGANWLNLRTFSTSVGNGWYVVTIVGRKTNAATSLTANIRMATADNTQSYTGDGTSNIYAWRATLVQSSVPTRLVQTTTTASTGTSQTGSALHVKGLPASTNGLLLPGDWIEIGGELKQCTATLNSDAAGLGYLQFEPQLVRSPANDDPVIVTDPMGKFLVSNIKIENEFGTQARVSYDLEHIYE